MTNSRPVLRSMVMALWMRGIDRLDTLDYARMFCMTLGAIFRSRRPGYCTLCTKEIDFDLPFLFIAHRLFVA